jgi:aspartate dehydrogenase
MTQPRRIGLIGYGAISKVVMNVVQRHSDNTIVAAILVRPGTCPLADLPLNCQAVDTVEKLLALAPDGIYECAGHDAVRQYGSTILSAGSAFSIVSVGALADSNLRSALFESAAIGNARLSIIAGAIAGVEALSAARFSGLESVEHKVVKPPHAWLGTPAEKLLKNSVDKAPVTFYDGRADEAVKQYPKNANVIATIALAGLGFENTRAILVSDPFTSTNFHYLKASGDFGSISVEIAGNSLPDNPKTSMLAAYSVARSIILRSGEIII